MTIGDLYPYLILIGSSIILAGIWLLNQARLRARITNELVNLNESVDFDLPNFLRECWPPLSKAGFRGISWQLNWFGSTLSESRGKEGEVFIQRKLEVDDISVVINLYDSPRRFEQRYFSHIVSDSFFLLLYTDMWVKLGTVQGAFAQTAKMSVFLQHDMKNIVQLVSLMAEQLENTPPNNEAKLMESIKTVMPTLRERSERFLNSLSSEIPKGDAKSVDLRDALHKTANIHDLHMNIEGDAQIDIDKQSLNSILDNLFGNYVDQGRINPKLNTFLNVQIKKGPRGIDLYVSDENGLPCQWPERLFEPFWSEKGDGLGVGLYHSRQLATASGGNLLAIAEADKPLVFHLNLPGAA